MVNLLRSEFSRLWSRRMTQAFPGILAVLMVVGVVIAYFERRRGHQASPEVRALIDRSKHPVVDRPR